MKIFLDDSDISKMEFKTEVEWKEFIRHPTSSASTGKCHYDPQPRDLLPLRFPCLMLYDNSIIYNRDRNDEYLNFFIYHYSNLDDDKDDAPELINDGN